MQVLHDLVVGPCLRLVAICADVDEDRLLCDHLLLLRVAADVDRRSRCQAACRGAKAHHPLRTIRAEGIWVRQSPGVGVRRPLGRLMERREAARCQPLHGDSATQKQPMTPSCGCKSWMPRT